MVLRILVPVVGVALIVVGAVLLLQPVEFGWFAYAPLSDETFAAPWPTASHVAGFFVTIAGVAVLAGWVGFLLGRRRPASAR
jgi:heme/copper-type cytochrome/quinol oxidase subunit 1